MITHPDLTIRALQVRAEAVPMARPLHTSGDTHVLAVTPSCHWLEYVDWPNPILAEPLLVEDGHAQPSRSH